MSIARLRARVPAAERTGVFTLYEHSLRFHKLSRNDGSGKCDAFHTGNASDRVVGALFELSAREKKVLDGIEGLGTGYRDKTVLVTDQRGRTLEAVTYCATITDPSVLPYSWYLYHVIQGARETGVPTGYLATIAATRSIEDPDRERDARERAIYGRRLL
jgi:hypothetical protein